MRSFLITCSEVSNAEFFLAQKQHVTIDSLVLGQDSGLLQQACDMTGGLYIKVPNQHSVLQYLLVSNHNLVSNLVILPNGKIFHSRLRS